jgi:Uma2 family endonuclease
VWLPVADLLLVIEIVSPGSAGLDAVTKRDEYALAGIPQCWVVDRDNAQTVTLHQLSAAGAYEQRAQLPLAWLLNTAPGTHLG